MAMCNSDMIGRSKRNYFGNGTMRLKCDSLENMRGSRGWRFYAVRLFPS